MYCFVPAALFGLKSCGGGCSDVTGEGVAEVFRTAEHELGDVILAAARDAHSNTKLTFFIQSRELPALNTLFICFQLP